jgi:hypothetical protein
VCECVCVGVGVSVGVSEGVSVGVSVGVFGDIYDLHLFVYMRMYGNSERGLRGGRGGRGGGRGRTGRGTRIQYEESMTEPPKTTTDSNKYNK